MKKNLFLFITLVLVILVCSPIFSNEGAEPIKFNLSIEPEKYDYEPGDKLEITLNVQTSSEQNPVDIYFVLLNPKDILFYGMNWDKNPQPFLRDITLPASSSFLDILLFSTPIHSHNTLGGSQSLFNRVGTYTYAIAATQTGTMNLVSNIASVSLFLSLPIENDMLIPEDIK